MLHSWQSHVNVSAGRRRQAETVSSHHGCPFIHFLFICALAFLQGIPRCMCVCLCMCDIIVGPTSSSPSPLPSLCLCRQRRQLVCIQIKLVIYVRPTPPTAPRSYYTLPQPFAFHTLLPSYPLPPPSPAAVALPRRAHSIVRFVAHCRLIYHLALQAFSECNELLTSNCHAHNITPAAPRAAHPLALPLNDAGKRVSFCASN